MTNALIVIAHLLMGGAFIIFALRNTRNFERLAGVLAERRIPMPHSAARFGVALQFVGGALVLIAPFLRIAGVLGGLAMIVFLILATVLFHPAWEYQGEARKPHTSAVLMNTSLVGAFLMVIAYWL